MDKFSRIDIFTKVVELGSFSKAAESVNITKSAVSKQVQALEDSLGVRLLNRTTRSIHLTEEGEEFFKRCAGIIEELSDAEEYVKDLSKKPSGKLRITAPDAYGALYLAPKIADFIKEYPEIHVELDLEGGKVDMIQAGFDVSIFIGELEDSSLIARKIGDCPMVLLASPEYLKEHGEPKTVAELRGHKHIEYTKRLPQRGEWTYRCPNNRGGKLKINEVFATSNGQAICFAAEKGIGIACLPLYVCQPAIDDGSIIPIMEEYKFNGELGIYAIFPHRRNLSRKVRLFLDWIGTH